MTFYDFDLKKFNTINNNTKTIIDNLIKENKVFLKDVLFDLDIAYSTYRMARNIDFKEHEEIPIKILSYFGFSILRAETLNSINEVFNNFFSALYYSNLDQVALYFSVINEKKDLLMHSLLLPVFIIADTNANLVLNASRNRDGLTNYLLAQVALIDKYQAFCYGNLSIMVNILKTNLYAKQINKFLFYKSRNEILDNLVSYQRLEAYAKYVLSSDSFFINDIYGAIAYAEESLSKLMEDHNLFRMYYLKSNLAYYYIIGHRPEKARTIIESLLNYLNYQKDVIKVRNQGILEEELGYCLIEEKKYSLAASYLGQIIKNETKTGEIEIYYGYALYKSSNTKEFNSLWSSVQLEKDKNVNTVYQALNFLYSAMQRNATIKISEAFSEYKKCVQTFKYSYHNRLLSEEYEIIAKTKNLFID